MCASQDDKRGAEGIIMALPAPSSSGKEEGVLDGLWSILKTAKDNVVKHPAVVALALQSILALWQVRFANSFSDRDHLLPR